MLSCVGHVDPTVKTDKDKQTSSKCLWWREPQEDMRQNVKKLEDVLVQHVQCSKTLNLNIWAFLTFVQK